MSVFLGSLPECDVPSFLCSPFKALEDALAKHEELLAFMEKKKKKMFGW